METRAQQARLDHHEEQLKQLQSDVLEIKTAIKAWETDRAEEEEFRKIVMAWVKQQGKQPNQDVGGPSRDSSGSTILPTPLVGNIPVSQGGVTPISEFHQGGGIAMTGGSPLFGLQSDSPQGFPWAAKKIKLPEFHGFDPQGWIKKADLYFEIHGTPPHLCIRLAQLSMVGVAQHWFTIVNQIYESLSWEQLTRELLQRFSGLEIQNPYEQLATIKQVTSIHDYIDDFEYLLSLVPRLPESQALGYFVAGLRDEVKRWVRLHRPQSRLDAMYLAKDVEEMIQPSSGNTSLSRFRYQFGSGSPYGQAYETRLSPLGRDQKGPMSPLNSDKGTFQSPDANRSFSSSRIPGVLPFDNPHSGNRNRGVRSLTRTEWEERRKKGLCFRCGQQFGPTHKCPEGSLRILLLGEDETRADDADFQFLDASLEDKTLIEGQSNVRDPIIMDQIK